MLIRWSQLKKLPVHTQSGIYLGRVIGFELDADSHAARVYFVRKMFGPELSVHRGQVISITAEKMTVEDSFVKEAVPYAAITPSNS